MKVAGAPTTLSATLMALFLAFATIAAKSDERSEAAAITVSKTWLALIDGGRYDQGWNAAAKLLKRAASKEELVRALTSVRTPLGGVVARKLKSKHYATSLPGVPDGNYVVIQYDTVFANKRSSVETITPMLEPDGIWRVSGYYIR